MIQLCSFHLGPKPNCGMYCEMSRCFQLLQDWDASVCTLNLGCFISGSVNPTWKAAYLGALRQDSWRNFWSLLVARCVAWPKGQRESVFLHPSLSWPALGAPGAGSQSHSSTASLGNVGLDPSSCAGDSHRDNLFPRHEASFSFYFN